MEQYDLPLIRQYRAWLENGASDGGRERYFRDGLIVLDTNVLHSLYEYTPSAREQVLAALERVAHNMWLPYQVGLEFVRGRHRVIDKRSKALNDAPAEINRKFNEARQAIMAASAIVKNLLTKYTQDLDATAAIDREISQEKIDDLMGEWRRLLNGHAKQIKDAHDIALRSLGQNDPILPKIAALYGDRVAEQPPMETLRRRVEEATNYRFPNRIPPGFMDEKSSPLESAGDFLIWEEVVEKSATLKEPRLVLFVSADAKDDWYEPAEPGRGPRPWPLLADELQNRSGAKLRIESPNEFFQGVRDYLHAEIAEDTSREIDRALESYLTTTRQLQQDVQELVRSGLPERCEEFYQILETLHQGLIDAYSDRIPEKYLKVGLASRVHELLFSILLQRIGEDVPVELLRAATGDSIHTERRVRELREFGIDIEQVQPGQAFSYRLNSLNVDLNFARTQVRRNIFLDRHLSRSEKEALIEILDS